MTVYFIHYFKLQLNITLITVMVIWLKLLLVVVLLLLVRLLLRLVILRVVEILLLLLLPVLRVLSVVLSDLSFFEVAELLAEALEAGAVGQDVDAAPGDAEAVVVQIDARLSRDGSGRFVLHRRNPSLSRLFCSKFLFHRDEDVLGLGVRHCCRDGSAALVVERSVLSGGGRLGRGRRRGGWRPVGGGGGLRGGPLAGAGNRRKDWSGEREGQIKGRKHAKLSKNTW